MAADSFSPPAPHPWLPADSESVSVGGGCGVPASGARDGVSAILLPEQQLQLAAALPRAVRGYGGARWHLLFSLQLHGSSLETLLNRAADRRDTLLVVRDSKGAVFGAFCAEPWARVRGYFGTGDCFLFTFERRARADSLRERILRADARRAALHAEEEQRRHEREAVGLSGGEVRATGEAMDAGQGIGGEEGDSPPPVRAELDKAAPTTAPARRRADAGARSSPDLHVYRWARRNGHFMYVSLEPNAKQIRVATGLGVGGGEYCALHLDETLDRGCSGPCNTFLSPPLARGEDGDEEAEEEWEAIERHKGRTGEQQVGAGSEAEATEADLRLRCLDLGRDVAFRALDVELFCFE